jgi:serine protease AprX
MLALILALLSCATGALFGNANKLSSDLLRPVPDKNGMVSVIIQYKQEPGHAEESKIASRGGSVDRHLQLVNALLARIPEARLPEFERDLEVAYITPDRPVASRMNNAAANVKAPFAWSQGLTGKGIGVAVIDGGITIRENLPTPAGTGNPDRIVYQADYSGSGANAGGSQLEHGTYIAGIIGGNGPDALKTGKCAANSCFLTIYGMAPYGMAPNVNLIDLKALNRTGQGSDSSVISAISAAIQLHNTYDIRIINLSLGRRVYESYTLDPLCRAVEQAWKAGIVVVVAAGNDGGGGPGKGYGTINSPGNDPYVITVGAMNTKGSPTRAEAVQVSYSSKGPTFGDSIVKPDLVAPGNLLVSPAPQVAGFDPQPGGHDTARPASAVSQLSGTSVAAGVVSGAVALLLQNDPTLTPDMVKARLMKTARKALPNTATVVAGNNTYIFQDDVFTVGAGYLDLEAALANTDRAALPALSPALAISNDGRNISLIVNSNAIWDSSASWSYATLWGGKRFVNNPSALRGGAEPASTPGPWEAGSLWNSESGHGSGKVARTAGTVIIAGKN